LNEAAVLPHSGRWEPYTKLDPSTMKTTEVLGVLEVGMKNRRSAKANSKDEENGLYQESKPRVHPDDCCAEALALVDQGFAGVVVDIQSVRFIVPTPKKERPPMTASQEDDGEDLQDMEADGENGGILGGESITQEEGQQDGLTVAALAHMCGIDFGALQRSKHYNPDEQLRATVFQSHIKAAKDQALSKLRNDVAGEFALGKRVTSEAVPSKLGKKPKVTKP
jgi:hypothetical protein